MKTEKFLAAEGKKVNLKDHPTDFTGDFHDKKEAVTDLEKNVLRLAELQDVLYAQNIHSLLLIFQAMDAAGKDSVVKHVMSGINPLKAARLHPLSSRPPRSLSMIFCGVAKELPERGRIGIFNRSHYEEVLVVRVHAGYLMSQQLPEEVKTDKDIWKNRFRQIRNWEDTLAANGTHVLKFFLNVSREEQKRRFLERIDRPDKNWKFNSGDSKERALWDDYMKAYEDAIEGTSTKESPWYIIPADKKWFTRLAVSEIIIKRMESLDLKYPQVSDAQHSELLEAKRILESED